MKCLSRRCQSPIACSGFGYCRMINMTGPDEEKQMSTHSGQIETDTNPTTKSDVVLWVIEHPENGKRSPFYWGIEEGEQGWTCEIKWAFKFETAEEAEKQAAGVGIPDYQIVDHKWLDHKPTSNLDVA